VDGLGAAETPALELNCRAGEFGAPSTSVIIGPEFVPGLSTDMAEAEAQITERLRPYPSARGEVCAQREPGVNVALAWLQPDDEVGRRRISDIAPPFCGPDTAAYLRPALNGSDDTLAPLAMWFATLLALSTLARYHPERWTSVLDRDRSRLAIPIEEALNAGWALLPRLLLHEFSGCEPRSPLP
jgi:hypothetical protein